MASEGWMRLGGSCEALGTLGEVRGGWKRLGRMRRLDEGKGLRGWVETGKLRAVR